MGLLRATAGIGSVPDMPLHARTLLGPGPSNPYPEATIALGEPLLGHLDPVFLRILDETSDRLRQVFGTTNRRTLPLSATGSAGMEASFVNTVGPGDVVVVAVNGLFGAADGRGRVTVRGRGRAVEHEWGQPVDPDRVLAAHPAPKLIAAVHAETSTGVLSDLEPLAAGKGDALLLADCVTSLGGVPVRLDDWGVDLAYSGSQKCLGVAPGLAPFTIGDRAWERRIEKPQSWYLDLGLLGGYAGRRPAPGGPTTTRRRRAWSSPCTPASAGSSRRVSTPCTPGTPRPAGCCTRASRRWGSSCSPPRGTGCRSSPR